MEIIVIIISIIIAIAGLIFGIYQYRRRKIDAMAREEFGEKKYDRGKNYGEHISQKFKYLDFTGLNAILLKPLLLEDIYVRLCVRETGLDFVAAFKNLYEEHKNKQEPLKLVILGQPGSGKTMLLKWIALQCVRGGNSIFSRFIPVFLALKTMGWDPDKTFRTKNILDITLDWLRNENISTAFIHDAFEEGKILFLLDGLDEVADNDLRMQVIEWLVSQHFGNNIMLVTSRISAPQEAKGSQFHSAMPVFTIRDFDIADIERFLENWYRSIEVAVAGEEDKIDREEAIKKGKSSYEDLMNIIKSDAYKNLRQLAVNPLLLTIIAIVHRTRAVLPGERHKLYDECLRVMIELWNVANKKLNISFSVENSMDSLSKIAVLLMEQNRREIELSEIKTVLPTEIEKQPLDFFIHQMVLRTGLLYESEGKYGFLNRVFQEYLAAYHYARNPEQNKILRHRSAPAWRETFKLFVNIANVRIFFNEIIDNLFKFETDYWLYMPLWNACLQDIVVVEARLEIESQFAKKIREFIPAHEKNEWDSDKDAELLNYFANLSPQELREFQYNNPEFIAGELSKGNYNVLKEESISDDTLQKVEKGVEFDLKTVEKLLDFKVNFENQKENLLPIRAFFILKRANFKKLRELIVRIIESHEEENVQFNALYIFKKVN